MLKIVVKNAHRIFYFIIRPFKHLFYYANTLKSEGALLKKINQNHSNFRLYTTKQLKKKLYSNASSSHRNYIKLLTLSYKQAKYEQQGIAYAYWIKGRQTSKKRALQQEKAFKNKQTILFFISNTHSQKMKGSLIKQTLCSLSNQTNGSWQASLTYNSSMGDSTVLAGEEFPENFTKNYTDDESPLNRFIDLEIKRTSASCICIIPQGTLLATHAIDTLLHAFNECSADMVYSDDDLMSLSKKRHFPHFKPDWNPDYFYSLNYLSHACVLSSSLFTQLQSKQHNYDDYFYRALLKEKARLNKLRVKHIPDVLFHYPENTRHLNYKLHTSGKIIKNEPLASIIIPSRDEVLILQQCINSILEKTAYSNFEILIIDNQSEKQETFEYLAQISNDPRIRILQYQHSFNYSAINNYAVKHARGKLLAFVNNDIEVINTGWLTEMVFQALRPEIGCVGAKLYYPDGTIQHGGVILGIHGTASHAHKHFSGDDTGYFGRLSVVHNVSAVTAACMVVRKSVFNKSGGFDEDNLKIAYNDVDLCLKVLDLGYRNLWTPFAELIHYESKSRGKKHTKETRERLDQEEAFIRSKWMQYLKNDPAYNVNLTLTREDFSLGNSRH